MKGLVMKAKYILYGIILVLSNTFLFAGTHRPDVPDTKFVEYGAKFGCVMPVTTEIEANISGIGSCVVINEHWCITAAHVTSGAKNVYVMINGSKFHIDKVIINKEFNMDTNFGKGDISLLYSKKSFGKVFVPELYTGRDEVGKICTIAGYGYTGTFSTGAATGHDYKKRGGTNTIAGTMKEMLTCHANRGGTRLEFIISAGDSGGGMFIDGKLAGISSLILTNNKTIKGVYGDTACFTRVSSYIEWINKHVKR